MAANDTATATDVKDVKGPERFFYDKSTYTGAHSKGGPSNPYKGGDGEDGYMDLSNLI